jgi:hypothetical protein
VAAAHGFVKDADGEHILVVIVEDKEVSGNDLVHAAEPPLNVREVHHA